ncbi:MAG TPA: amidohydrolase family protein [Acidimicrobiales bacterium]|nr:amidohydrolase family protein [Acidimicrobiales bacterium]
MAIYDLVIRGGTLADGTGGPLRSGDVGVRDGRIVAVGEVDGDATRTIDADGALVAPGFVDIHTHYDGQATWDSALAPSSWHGVTTVVAGNCGVGFAPVRPSDHQRLIELMEGVEDIPGAALHEGLSWDWQTFGEYMDAVERVPHDIDIGLQLPHGALRLHVMGERGADREPATGDDIAEMAEIARQAVLDGALGFTTSRTMNHRTSTGDYTPTLTAEADELVGIASGLGAAGRGVLQVVSDYRDVDAEFAIFRRMAEESGRPLSTSLAQSSMAPSMYRRVLELLAEANADGVPMRAQVAARAVGILLGLQCTWNPFLRNPVYQEIAGLPVAERAQAMGDPAFKARLLEVDRPHPSYGEMFELGDPPDYEPDPSSSIAARAARDGRQANEYAYEIIRRDEGRAFLYQPFLNWADGNLDAVGEMLADPNAVPGLSDGGAHVGTICDGSFPTTLLTLWGRDRDRGQLGLPLLVARQCRDTAATVGLHDRGVLAPGYRADINVIDHERLTMRAPEMHFDLPAGGKRLLQRAEGYLHTIVAGEGVYEDGEATGARPGRLVRGPQEASR